MQLSLIIPAYNEASAIRAGKLAQVRRWLQSQPFQNELIVVDDQSQDETAALAAEWADTVIRISHAGKAAAIIAGIQAARGEWVLFSDMDQATPISESIKLLSALQAGQDVAVGSRGLVRKDAPPGRYILSWGQSLLKYLLLGMHITDTQCGFKAFKRTAALDIVDHLVLYSPTRLRTLTGPSVNSGFDVEVLFLAQQLGYQIQEIPVEWNYQQTRRVSLLRDAFRGLCDLLKIFGERLKGKYKSIPGRLH